MQAKSFALMLLVMFIVGYLTMSVLIDKNVLFSLNNVYAALYMVLWMGAASAFLELALPSEHNKNAEKAMWGAVAGGLAIAAVLFSFVVKKQLFIDESQFLRSMIEHHEMAVVMAQRLLAKDALQPETRQLATNIVATQTREIAQMYRLLNGSCR
jgi:cobalamin biosynthesis protein CobD/CbiB